MKELVWGLFHGVGTIECYCDLCSNSHDFEFEDGYPDFKECQEELKDMGWLSRKINDIWYDFCCEECFYQWIKENK